MRSIVNISLCLTVLSCLAADQPATKPLKTPDYMIGEMNLQTIRGMNYFSQSRQVTVDQIGATAGEVMPNILKVASDGQFQIGGPAMFVFHGDIRPGNTFTMQVGFIAQPGGKPQPPFQYDSLPQFQCATVVYTGPIADIDKAYEKLFGDIANSGLTTTDESRQMILYFEGPESPNNVIQIQVGVQGL
jgi:effector-binding domain-containing protein